MQLKSKLDEEIENHSIYSIHALKYPASRNEYCT